MSRPLQINASVVGEMPQGCRTLHVSHHPVVIASGTRRPQHALGNSGDRNTCCEDAREIHIEEMRNARSKEYSPLLPFNPKVQALGLSETEKPAYLRPKEALVSCGCMKTTCKVESCDYQDLRGDRCR